MSFTSDFVAQKGRKVHRRERRIDKGRKIRKVVAAKQTRRTAVTTLNAVSAVVVMTMNMQAALLSTRSTLPYKLNPSLIKIPTYLQRSCKERSVFAHVRLRCPTAVRVNLLTRASITKICTEELIFSKFAEDVAMLKTCQNLL